MGFNQARQFTQRAGVPMAPLIDNMSLPQISSKEELDALFDRGVREMEAHGHSLAYNAAVALMARGADELLPLSQLNGAIPKFQGQLEAEIAEARINSAQFLMPERLPNQLREMHIGGQHISTIPVDILREQLALAMADSQPGPGRDAVSQLMAHVDSTPATSFQGIQWEAPEPLLAYEVNSSSSISDSNDAYGRLRAPGRAADHGLEGLAIKPSIAPGFEFAGITDWSGSGGTYEVASDPYMQAALQQADFHQGDAVNTFVEEV